MLTITKRYTFEASHQLPWHDGKCARLHGHSYILEVSVSGSVRPDNGDPDAGMIMDFGHVSNVVKPMIDKYFDHHHLNDRLELKNPTAERMVGWIVDYLEDRLPGVCRVRLYETATGWVEWTRDGD